MPDAGIDLSVPRRRLLRRVDRAVCPRSAEGLGKKAKTRTDILNGGSEDMSIKRPEGGWNI